MSHIAGPGAVASVAVLVTAVGLYVMGWTAHKKRSLREVLNVLKGFSILAVPYWLVLYCTGSGMKLIKEISKWFYSF